MEHSIRPIAFRPEWVKACGDVESTIIYQQLYYWVSTKRDEDISTVWIYKSISDFEFETTLTDKVQARVIRNLMRRKLIECEKRKAPDNRVTRYFRIVSPLMVTPLSPNGGGSTPQRGDVYTESTTESTVSTKVEREVTPPRVGKTLIKGDVFSKELMHINPKITEVVETLQAHLGMTLDGSVKQNRRYAHLLLTKYSKEQVQALLKAVPLSQFWKGKVTSVKDLYYNAAKIINSLKDQRGGYTDLSV